MEYDNTSRKKIWGSLMMVILGGLTVIYTFYILAAPQPVYAKSSDLATAMGKYPTISGTRLESCNLCHNPGTYSLNGYGSAYKANGRNIAAFGLIENQDSDGDSFSNVAEILALTFPGNAADKPAEPTATPTVPPTPTSVPPTASPTSLPPTATTLPPTASPTSLPPTATTLPPTATATQPTSTATSLPPTAAPTQTIVTPTHTATPTWTSVSPTETPDATRTPKPCKPEKERDDDHKDHEDKIKNKVSKKKCTP